MMDEQVLLTVFGRNEPEALVVVEPLHCSCRTHGRTPWYCWRARAGTRCRVACSARPRSLLIACDVVPAAMTWLRAAYDKHKKTRANARARVFCPELVMRVRASA